jgi:hypothetical protein
MDAAMGSITLRAPAVRNPDPSHLDLSVTYSHGFAMPVASPLHTRFNGEPVIEQSRSSAASLPLCGKQFECTSLARVELMFSMQSTHRIALRRNPASTRRMIPLSRVVQGRTVILRSLGKRPVSSIPAYDFFIELVEKRTDNPKLRCFASAIDAISHPISCGKRRPVVIGPGALSRVGADECVRVFPVSTSL